MTHRVIDLIAMLQAVDPVAPLEVWVEKAEETRRKFVTHRLLGVQQITPIYLKAKGLPYDQGDENPPLPVVVFCEVADERAV